MNSKVRLGIWFNRSILTHLNITQQMNIAPVHNKQSRHTQFYVEVLRLLLVLLVRRFLGEISHQLETIDLICGTLITIKEIIQLSTVNGPSPSGRSNDFDSCQRGR